MSNEFKSDDDVSWKKISLNRKSISRISSINLSIFSFSICIFWICFDLNRAFFVKLENMKMRYSANWSMRFLKYFFFLMMFFFHETSSSNLKSFDTQISLNLTFWFFFLYVVKILTFENVRKTCTNVAKSFFLKNLISSSRAIFTEKLKIFIHFEIFCLITRAIIIVVEKDKEFLIFSRKTKNSLFFEKNISMNRQMIFLIMWRWFVIISIKVNA